jgi:uncharacterized membrane protein YeiH
MLNLGLEKAYAVLIAISLAFMLRAAALSLGWTMPRYKPRKGRKIK